MAQPTSDSAFTGSVPELYDTLLVPMIFEGYAADMARRVAAVRPARKRVLEIAAGTGAVTRAMSRLLGPGTEIVATDLNPPMLARAAAIGTANPVQWQPADAQKLPFDDASFDVVVCQFGVMFFPDRPGAYAEARRVLKPGGTFLFNVWDRIADNEFTQTASDALIALYPADPPRFMERSPHGYFDFARIAADLAAGGFTATPVFETRADRSRMPSPQITAFAFCNGTPLRGEIDARAAAGGASLVEATEACAAALAARFGTGPIEGGISAHIVSVG